MSFTKVAPAGIGTEPGSTIRLGDSLLHSTGLDVGTGTGVGVTIRQHGDATFSGIVTASAFFGDGSGLEGVSSSGIGTPLSTDDTSDLNKIYYANQELVIDSTVTVNHPDTGIAAYTHYQDLVVKDNADFIVADGDTFIPDVLGINTSSLPNPVSSATGGRIRAGTITNAGANGAVNFPNGLVGTSATFTGVLTYEDVTNVDAVGIVTARSGINVSDGNVHIDDNGEFAIFEQDTSTAFTNSSKISMDFSSNIARIRSSWNGSGGNAVGRPLAFYIGESEKLRITSTGDVNIGGASPSSSALCVKMATDKHIGFSPSQSEVGNVPALVAFQDSGSLAEMGFRGTDLRFATVNTERLRITHTGALGTNATVRSANGGLDLCAQGATNLGTLTLGASGGQNGQNRNANTENQFRIMTPTYANPSNMFTVMYGASGSSLHEINYGGGTGWAYAANLHRFFTASDQTTGTGTERIRLTSGGKFYVGTTNGAFGNDASQHSAIVNSTANEYTLSLRNTVDANTGRTLLCACGKSTGGRLIFFERADGTTVGSITHNGSNTAYNTSSDYRLKENVNPITNGITKVKNLIPKRFNFIADPSKKVIDGFIAHEVATVVPEAVTGEKDEMLSDSEIAVQQLDASKLIPVLTAALKEAITKIETLETKVAALEDS